MLEDVSSFTAVLVLDTLFEMVALRSYLVLLLLRPLETVSRKIFLLVFC